MNEDQNEQNKSGETAEETQRKTIEKMKDLEKRGERFNPGGPTAEQTLEETQRQYEQTGDYQEDLQVNRLHGKGTKPGTPPGGYQTLGEQSVEEKLKHSKKPGEAAVSYNAEEEKQMAQAMRKEGEGGEPDYRQELGDQPEPEGGIKTEVEGGVADDDEDDDGRVDPVEGATDQQIKKDVTENIYTTYSEGDKAEEEKKKKNEDGSVDEEIEGESMPYDTMRTHAEIDRYAKEQKASTPKDWSDKTVADKKKWLDDNL